MGRLELMSKPEGRDSVEEFLSLDISEIEEKVHYTFRSKVPTLDNRLSVILFYEFLGKFDDMIKAADKLGLSMRGET